MVDDSDSHTACEAERKLKKEIENLKRAQDKLDELITKWEEI